jgi:hypothetical protein
MPNWPVADNRLPIGSSAMLHYLPFMLIYPVVKFLVVDAIIMTGRQDRHDLIILGLGQTSNFSCAEPNE